MSAKRISAARCALGGSAPSWWRVRPDAHPRTVLPPVPMRPSSCGDPADFRHRLMACRARRRTAPSACRPRRHPPAGPRRHPPAGPSGARFRIGFRRRCCSMARRARCAVIRHRVWHEAREVRVEFFALRLSRAGNRRTSPCFGQKPSHIGHHVPRGIAGYRTSGTTCQGGPLAAAHRRPRAKEPHEVPQAAAFVPKTQATASYHQGDD